MRGRLVTIIGVSGLLVVAAACSAPYADGGRTSEQTATEQPGAGTDKKDAEAPLEARPTPPPPVPGSDAGAGGPEAGTDASATDPTHCPSKAAPVVAAWKAPPAASSACTAGDITYFAGVAASQTWLGIQSLMTTRNANCSKCIFSKETDSAWRPVVYIGTQGDAIVNYSSCFARAPGGNDESSKALEG